MKKIIKLVAVAIVIICVLFMSEKALAFSDGDGLTPVQQAKLSYLLKREERQLLVDNLGVSWFTPDDMEVLKALGYTIYEHSHSIVSDDIFFDPVVDEDVIWALSTEGHLFAFPRVVGEDDSPTKMDYGVVHILSYSQHVVYSCPDFALQEQEEYHSFLLWKHGRNEALYHCDGKFVGYNDHIGLVFFDEEKGVILSVDPESKFWRTPEILISGVEDLLDASYVCVQGYPGLRYVKGGIEYAFEPVRLGEYPIK